MYREKKSLLDCMSRDKLQQLEAYIQKEVARIFHPVNSLDNESDKAFEELGFKKVRKGMKLLSPQLFPLISYNCMYAIGNLIKDYFSWKTINGTGKKSFTSRVAYVVNQVQTFINDYCNNLENLDALRASQDDEDDNFNIGLSTITIFITTLISFADLYVQ